MFVYYITWSSDVVTFLEEKLLILVILSQGLSYIRETFGSQSNLFESERHVQKVYQQALSDCLMTNSKTPTVQEMFLNTFDNWNLFQPEKRVNSLHKSEDEASFTRPLSCQRRRSLPIWLWLELRPQNGRVHLGLWKIEGDGQDKRHQINPSHKHVRFGQNGEFEDDLNFGTQLWWNRHTYGQIPAPECFKHMSKFTGYLPGELLHYH